MGQLIIFIFVMKEIWKYVVNSIALDHPMIASNIKSEVYIKEDAIKAIMSDDEFKDFKLKLRQLSCNK